MSNILLRNKPRVGRGARGGCGQELFANTKHLMRLIRYFQDIGEDGASITDIRDDMGLCGARIKDGLKFLMRIGFVEVHKSKDRKWRNTRVKLYRLKEGVV